MQKIQHLKSLPISIHPPDKSQGPRPAGEEVGSCVPDPLQLQHCVYGGDEESPRNLHKGAQSCHQARGDREVSDRRVRLGTASPNTVRGDLIIVLKQYSQCCMQMCPEEDYSTVVETLAIDDN